MPSSDKEIFSFSSGEGRHKISLVAIRSGADLVVNIKGGDRPHVGAISVAIPRPSLENPRRTSASSSVITLTGHKDDEVARPLSEKIARELNRVVVVAAGIHVDDVKLSDIKTLLSNSNKCAEELISRLRRTNSP